LPTVAIMRKGRVVCGGKPDDVIDAAMVATVFSVAANVSSDTDGRLIVTPLRAIAAAQARAGRVLASGRNASRVAGRPAATSALTRRRAGRIAAGCALNQRRDRDSVERLPGGRE